MKCDNDKIITMSYLLLESLNRKELLKVIVLLIGAYFRESEDKQWQEIEGIKALENLDKIKAEITERYSDCDICDYDDNIIFEYVRVGTILDILAIIDKYKAESEE